MENRGSNSDYNSLARRIIDVRPKSVAGFVHPYENPNSGIGRMGTLILEEFVDNLTYQDVDALAMRLAGAHKVQHSLTKVVSCQLHGTVLSAFSNQPSALSKYRLARNISGACNEAMLWTSAIPTSPDMIIPPATFRILVAQALGNPLPGFQRVQHRRCLCGASLGHEGYHMLSCYRTYAHDKVVRVINDMCRSSKLASEVEPLNTMNGDRRPDILIPNLRSDGKSYLGDFASVDPTRISSIQLGWCTPGHAALQRAQEKRDSYHGFYDPSAFEMIPLIMETTGRMHVGFKRFLAEVATFASKHLPTGGVGEHRFRSRFLKYWKSRIVVTFLKALATSAAHSQQAITARASNNQMLTRVVDIF